MTLDVVVSNAAVAEFERLLAENIRLKTELAKKTKLLDCILYQLEGPSRKGDTTWESVHNLISSGRAFASYNEGL